VFFAQNLNVLGGGSWTQAKVKPVATRLCLPRRRPIFIQRQTTTATCLTIRRSPPTRSPGGLRIATASDPYADNTGTAKSGEAAHRRRTHRGLRHTDYVTQNSGHGSSENEDDG